MSAGSISLESAIRTCKVQTSNANKIDSDRFLNPQNMVCPVWNGLDTQGREVCVDSYFTKRAGCNSAQDRVVVENNLRPQYMEYVNLSANGFDSPLYSNSMSYYNEGLRTKSVQNAQRLTGSFGDAIGANVEASCGDHNYERAMQQMSKSSREAQALNRGYWNNRRRKKGGMRR